MIACFCAGVRVSFEDRENPLIVDFTTEELAYLKSACEKLADKPAPDNLWATVEKIYAAALATA